MAGEINFLDRRSSRSGKENQSKSFSWSQPEKRNEPVSSSLSVKKSNKTGKGGIFDSLRKGLSDLFIRPDMAGRNHKEIRAVREKMLKDIKTEKSLKAGPKASRSAFYDKLLSIRNGKDQLELPEHSLSESSVLSKASPGVDNKKEKAGLHSLWKRFKKQERPERLALNADATLVGDAVPNAYGKRKDSDGHESADLSPDLVSSADASGSAPWWEKWFKKHREKSSEISITEPKRSRTGKIDLFERQDLGRSTYPRSTFSGMDRDQAPQKEEQKFAPSGQDSDSAWPLEKHRWEATRVIETNLIQGETVSNANLLKSLKVMFVAAIVGVIVVILAYGVLFYVGQEKEKSARLPLNESSEARVKINRIEKNSSDIIYFAKKLKLAKAVLDNHIYWTNFFDMLEKNTITDVYYINFRGDTNGSYNLPARAKLYENIYEQIEAFRAHPSISSVEASGGRISSDFKNKKEAVDFNMAIQIDPNIFKK